MKLKEEFKNILNEKVVENFETSFLYRSKHYTEVFKNPTTKEIADFSDIRGFIDKNGDLFVTPSLTQDYIHSEILLNLYGQEKITDFFDEDWSPKRKSNMVHVQRYKKTNEWYLSDSYPFDDYYSDDPQIEWEENYKKWVMPLIKKCNSKGYMKIIPQTIRWKTDPKSNLKLN